MTTIKSFIPPDFDVKGRSLLEAIYKAVDASTGRLSKMVSAGIDQQFLITATGRYLLFLGEQEGFAMPPNSGLDIRALRALVPAMVATPKQVVNTLNRLIEIFYTTEKVKPSTTASAEEPYNLSDGDDLIVETESGISTISILEDQVSDISNVAAAELAGIINNSQTLYLADVFLNRRTNRKFVRITSKTYGVGSFIRVIGGTVQNVARFPKLVDTNNIAGTTWNVTKSATYTDVTRFQWNGVGVNPQTYKLRVGDIVTIRGLTDGIDQLSLFNGSYKISDAGYDYFVVNNPRFPFIIATAIEPANNSFTFTSSDKNILYDLEEYGILSETIDATTTITVPAIPPLARRFLSGSAHLHGAESRVVDFTRSTISVDESFLESTQDPNNIVVLFSRSQRHSFRVKDQIKTNLVSGTSPLIYTIDSSDPEYAVMPFTNPQAMTATSIRVSPRDSNIIMKFNFKHGFNNFWGFTVAGLPTTGNYTGALLNQEHRVAEVIDDYTVRFRIYDANSTAIPFSGIATGVADVHRHLIKQSDDSDFYLEFASVGAVSASGLKVGDVFVIDGSLGTNVNMFYGERLRHAKLLVKSVNGTSVNFFSGFGHGFGGLMISNAESFRSEKFGAGGTFFFDKTSAHNKAFVMDELFIHFMGYTKSVNEGYVGSFLFDPTGIHSQNTMSNIVVANRQIILKGENRSGIFVDTVEGMPTSGYLMLNYGSHAQEGPIFYLSTIENQNGDSQILIDPSYRFKFGHAIGENVQYIHSLRQYTPDQFGKDFPVYLTGTAQARRTMLTLLKLLIATGVFLDFQVLFPDLKFDDPAILPFE